MFPSILRKSKTLNFILAELHRRLLNQRDQFAHAGVEDEHAMLEAVEARADALPQLLRAAVGGNIARHRREHACLKLRSKHRVLQPVHQRRHPLATVVHLAGLGVAPLARRPLAPLQVREAAFGGRCARRWQRWCRHR